MPFHPASLQPAATAPWSRDDWMHIARQTDPVSLPQAQPFVILESTGRKLMHGASILFPCSQQHLLLGRETTGCKLMQGQSILFHRSKHNVLVVPEMTGCKLLQCPTIRLDLSDHLLPALEMIRCTELQGPISAIRCILPAHSQGGSSLSTAFNITSIPSSFGL